MPSTPASASPNGRPEGEGTSFGAWTLVWCLYLTKLATIVIVVLMQHSYDAAVFVTITTWFWFGPLLALGAAPLLFRLRLRRVRRRRADLQRAEWIVSTASHADAGPDLAPTRYPHSHRSPLN